MTDPFQRNGQKILQKLDDSQNLKDLSSALSCLTDLDTNNADLLSSVDDLVEETKNIVVAWIDVNILTSPDNSRTLGLIDGGIQGFRTNILAFILSFNQFSEVVQSKLVSPRFHDVVEARDTCLLRDMLVIVRQTRVFPEDYWKRPDRLVDLNPYLNIGDLTLKCALPNGKELFIPDHPALRMLEHRSPRVIFFGGFPQMTLYQPPPFYRACSELPLHSCFLWEEAEDEQPSQFCAKVISVNPFQLNKINFEYFPNLICIRLYIEQEKGLNDCIFRPRKVHPPFVLDTVRADFDDDPFPVIKSIHLVWNEKSISFLTALHVGRPNRAVWLGFKKCVFEVGFRMGFGQEA